ncbi:MAG: ATP phosphoribosyltransferase regulatory subunit, partial [Pseudomonadota bacterium]|nr:ATP phosphoribosyltransferase regulatory subunit [Pseudomonadota bacterium]
MTTDIAAGLLPEGLRDRLPPQAEAAATLLRGLLDHVAAHGYERVQPPLIEYEEGLAGRLGGASRQELLRFVDPVSQRTLALRSDMTGQVGRIAATRLAHYARPLRLGYGGPVLRVKGS